MFIILTIVYSIIGISLCVMLMKEPNFNQEDRDVYFCYATIVLWPLFVLISIGWGIYDSWLDAKKRKMRAKVEAACVLLQVLFDLGVIRYYTKHVAQRKTHDW